MTRPVGDTVLSLHDARSSTPDSVVAPGGLLERYAVIEEVGRGGMGVVLRAYDPKLQREVALKVVRAESSETEARLNREARAMAALNHPNVVAIYDVTVHETPGPCKPQIQVVLAMEFVAGCTLRRWRELEERSTEEILDTLVQAGRGLAAAHREGLLHRDFKPDNVLVGDDGRVRVSDFGLARVDGDRNTQSAIMRATGEWDDIGEDDLTRVGTILGTPKYMAPEQHRAQTLDAAADQYAFCVTLWEALLDAPPFKGRTLDALLQEKLSGPPAFPRGVAAVPSRVVEALRRGLSPDPRERFATTDDLLAVLAPPPATIWRARGLMLAAAGGVVGLAATWIAMRADDTLCSGAEDQLAGVWDSARRDALESAFVEGDIGFAADVWQRIGPQLDAWGSEWIAMHEDSCEATRLRGEQSEAVMDLRIACLHRARQQLHAVVDVLAEPTPTTVENAHEVVDGLPALQRCADVEALQADVPPPDSHEAEAVAAIRTDLADATARRRAGEYAPAFEAVRRADTASTEIDYRPVRTEVLVELGTILSAMDRYDEAEAALREAQQLGAQWRQWDAVRVATNRLILVLGYEKAAYTEALTLRELALGLSSESPEAEAFARNNIGLVLVRLGRFEEAEAEHLAALELRRTALGPDHPDVASSRNNLANVLIEQGRYAEAEAEYRASFELRKAALGPDHPEVAISRNNLGLLLQELGKYEEAEAEHRAAMAMRIGAFGPQHPDVAASRNNLGMVLQLQNRFDEAEAEYRGALALWERTLGSEHPNIARSRMNLASVLSASGRQPEAEAEYRAALASQLAKWGPEHPEIAATRHNLAIALKSQGKLAEAEAEFRAAIELRTKLLGAEHPDVASTRNNLGNVLKEQGKLDEAEAEHRIALAVRLESLGAEHPEIATSHYNIGAILFEAGNYDEAEAEYRTAITMREKLLAADHVETAEARQALANVLLRKGERDEAVKLLERAWEVEEHATARPANRGHTAFHLAQAIWPTQRDRARTLAEAAQRSYAQAGPLLEEDRADVVAWLRTH